MFPMSFEVEYTDEFGGWWDGLSEREQDSVRRAVQLLETAGPHLPFPHSSSVRGSRYSHMRELRVQHDGRPYRVLYAFDPRRVAILLIGGDKTGDGRWYQRLIPMAEALYDEHLDEVAAELEGV
jgi:hypothetical protein